MLARRIALDSRPARHRSDLAGQDPLVRRSPFNLPLLGWARKPAPLFVDGVLASASLLMRRSFGSRRIRPTPMRASSTARSIPAVVKFHAARTALAFPTSGSTFPAAFLTSPASPSKNRAPPSPAVQYLSVASYAPPFRAESRLLNEGQASYSFALWRRYATLFGFEGAAFYSHDPPSNCAELPLSLPLENSSAFELEQGLLRAGYQ